jgi:glycosyltransferase involved in cell wall biosynthesis
MKVLFGVYPWAFDTPGGGERQLLAYKEHLTKMGVQVDLYDQWSPRIKDYDIFHFFSAMPGSLQLCDYVKKQGLKLVISPNLWITEQTKHLYPFDDVKNILSIADVIVVNSKMERDVLSSVLGIDIGKFSVVYNGVEEVFFQDVSPDIFRAYYHIDKPYILNVANVEQRKNQLQFLKVQSKISDISLITIGHVRDYEYYQECMKVGGGRYVVLDPLPYASELLRSAIKGAEFFVMPSTLETPSIAALEAATMGKNVLITQEGSTREYFLDFASYLDPSDDASIAEAIVKVSEKEDSGEIVSYMKQFQWSKVVVALKKIYENQK